jgi:phosphoribosyl 1,2-cyclic phosphodiesterase
MEVRFWGVRGSVPVANEQMLRYGGNTSCVEVVLADGTEIILDAGTGIRDLGAARASAAPSTHVLLTHLHLDHIQGLLFFAPLFNPANEVTVYGPPAPGPGLDRRLARYLSDPLSPVELRDLPADTRFTVCPHEEWEIGSARVRAAIVAHRGVTLGYRITEGETALCYLPDHEPALGSDLAAADAGWISGLDIAAGATALIHDGQYTDDEYAGHVGWGHSGVSDTVTFARRAGVERLLLFHHDPTHSDADLDELSARTETSWTAQGGEPTGISLATEGMRIAL